MEVTAIIMLAVMTIIVYFYKSGQKRVKMMETTILATERSISRQHQNPFFLGRVSYHGGFPPIPKPAVLRLAVVEDGAIFYDETGRCEKSHFRTWFGIDKFCTRSKSNPGIKSVFAGPFAGMFRQDRLRYFIVIKYFDVDGQKNNILLEADSREAQQLAYERVSGCLAPAEIKCRVQKCSG